ncbi:MAG TPA: hypothetical protein VEV20_14580 [Burkholderiales bacterium]|nr:hypothetical protein [Burkholderiales bacterium]
MNRFLRTALISTALGFALCGAGLAQTREEPMAIPAPPEASPVPWPRQFNHGDSTFTIYPPQLDRWQGDRLEGRAAVAVQSASSDKPSFGVLTLIARTEADGAGTVLVRELTASRASFPAATDRAAAYLDAIRQNLAGMTWSIPAERLRVDVAIDHATQQARGEPLRNDPPRIIYTQSPAILIPIDGQPVLREMVGLDLMRVLNTQALLLVEKSSGRYFLFVAGRWCDAPSLDGPWTDAEVRPAALEEAKEEAVEGGQVDLLESSETTSGRNPTVIVSTAPAELVETEGPPQYSPIERTQLLYVTNSPNRLFLDLSTQQYYVLLAGRWFRTRSLTQGPWEYVAGTALPADFAMIPASHPTETVRAAVPGTPQAQEAVIANSVPQVATINRNAAQLDVAYDGLPQFRPIEATSLEYAVNAPLPVIRVDWHNYYALDNGVWFFSESPDGPWAAATSVPAVIYAIPRSSPMHYVTYVRVYDATADDVYVGYTPGYVGSYVTPDSTVVYGTGWYYQPWIGSVYYCPPVTYGFGFSYWNTWWNPWPWRPWRAGWGHHHPHYGPAWGPWARHTVVRSQPIQHGVVAQAPAPLNRNRVTMPANATVNVTDIYHRWDRNAVSARPLPARPSRPRQYAAPVIVAPVAAAPRAMQPRQSSQPIVVTPAAPRGPAQGPVRVPSGQVDPRRVAPVGSPLITVPPAVATPAPRRVPRQAVPLTTAPAALPHSTPRPAAMDRPMYVAPAIDRPAIGGPAVAAPPAMPGASRPAPAARSDSKTSSGQSRSAPVMR